MGDSGGGDFSEVVLTVGSGCVGGCRVVVGLVWW